MKNYLFSFQYFRCNAVIGQSSNPAINTGDARNIVRNAEVVTICRIGKFFGAAVGPK